MNKLTPIKILLNRSPYKAGDICGVDADTAAQMVEGGFAEYVFGADGKKKEAVAEVTKDIPQPPKSKGFLKKKRTKK